MELVNAVLAILTAYWIGQFLIAWLDSRQKASTASKQQIVDVLNRMVREVNIENYHGLAYWFDKENDRFLAQGATTQEIVSVLKERFPDNIFLLPNGQVISAPNWQPADKTAAIVTQSMFDKFVK